MDSQLRGIRKILNYVNNNSKFYRKRFKQYGIDPKKISSILDFQKIPFTTREDLTKNNPYDFLCVPESEIEFMRFSSGTTNNRIIVNLKTKKEVGIKKSSRIANKVFSGSRKRLKILILVQPDRLPYLNQRWKIHGHIPVPGNLYNLPSTALIASNIKINAIITMPTVALLFSKYLERVYDLKNIKFLSLSGENLSPLKLKLLEKKYPNAKIRNIYSLVEVSRIGFLCMRDELNKTRTFHTCSKLFYEIVNPVTNESCEFGEQGELVVTRLEKIAMPLIRYKTGDLAQLIENNCKCGLSGHLLRVLGRANFDMVRVAGAELHADEIEKAVYSLKSYLTGDFQMHVYEKIDNGEVKPKIKMDIVLRDFLKKRKETIKITLENRIAENIRLSPRFTLKQAIEKKIFMPLEVNFVDDIPKIHKSKRIVDHRI